LDSILTSGVFTLSWWGVAVMALLLTHITIVCVTVFLHRCQTHQALELHPSVSHFCRFWLWLTTGMVTREWVAVHRKHHAKRETVNDPHSPKVLGINRVLWTGVLLYVKETRDHQTIERYGVRTPDDWLERHLYAKYVLLGLTLMGIINVALFGIVAGASILLIQILWIPFWAAGVINGLGHHAGYRNWSTDDASTNILAWGILIGGEELHNNHHAYPTSAKLSHKWYELDIGWMYIRALAALGLAHVKHLACVRPMPLIPQYAPAEQTVDLETLQAVIANRYEVLAAYARLLRAANKKELRDMRRLVPESARLRRHLRQWLSHGGDALADAERSEVLAVLGKSRALWTMYSMRRELIELWSRSCASKDQLVSKMTDWCKRAESSGVPALAQFSRQLRNYALS
jgi:stearoyl-CoA desaturase (Delta-9 desaturase)